MTIYVTWTSTYRLIHVSIKDLLAHATSTCSVDTTFASCFATLKFATELSPLDYVIKILFPGLTSEGNISDKIMVVLVVVHGRR